ncbi:MAG: bifunctional adenosylcobinamide kinase/adenosylcobinamide-phosphate guanylyltransferase, partial [Acidimicrobiales bacterium]
MIALIVGGARSGKSEIAERMAARLPHPVTYVATGDFSDEDMAERVRAHRARRPPSWATLELHAGGDLAGALSELPGTAVVDSLGTWLAGIESFRAGVSELCD